LSSPDTTIRRRRHRPSTRLGEYIYAAGDATPAAIARNGCGCCDPARRWSELLDSVTWSRAARFIFARAATASPTSTSCSSANLYGGDGPPTVPKRDRQARAGRHRALRPGGRVLLAGRPGAPGALRRPGPRGTSLVLFTAQPEPEPLLPVVRRRRQVRLDIRRLTARPTSIAIALSPSRTSGPAERSRSSVRLPQDRWESGLVNAGPHQQKYHAA
jgi:hypothetical protein